MTILTNFPKISKPYPCRYYVCFSNLGERPKCFKFSSEKKYKAWCNRNNSKNHSVSHHKYCYQQASFDRFYLLAESINYRLPIIKNA